MIFLFLTGTRLAYVNDILSVLYLPKGAEKTLKYKYTEHSGIVDESAGYEKCHQGDDVLILYYNEDENKEEEFIPLRKGRLRECINEDEQLYYRVELKEFVNVVDTEKQKSLFTDRIYHMLYLKAEERERDKKEGKAVKWIFAIRNTFDIDQYSDCLMLDENSWIHTVHRLAETPRFKSYYSVFAKIAIFKQSKEEVLCSAEGYKLLAGRNYKLVFSYFAHQFNSHPFVQIPVEFLDAIGVCRIPNSNYMVESEQNRVEVMFRPMKIDNNGQTNLWIKIPLRRIAGKTLQYPRGAIAVSVGGRMSNRLKMVVTIGIVFGMSVATYIAQFPYMEKLVQLETLLDKGQHLSRYQESMLWLCEQYQKMPELPIGLASVSVSILTFILVKLIGKPQI